MSSLTQARLKELLHYDPDTGIFTWIKKSKKSIPIGSIAGAKHNQGYRALCIDYKRYLAHRIAWLYVFGEMPLGFIDHINRNRSDNRISNLRVVNRSENQQNRKIGANNTSGVSGVYWHEQRKKWHARIFICGTGRSLGLFQTIEEAKTARQKAEREFYSLPD
jgi:hypothetical protein